MAEIIGGGTGAFRVTCVKYGPLARGPAAAKYRSRIAELGGFAEARCRRDAG
ncbi:hypothetical protein AB0C51_08015 [Streptomyces pathocidini]|uniref:Uncharacterized protein n=1 Tax=Streptomyces pathocidini TaxID=1650571 RepID=A0ABW7UQL5_9ACTN|nr:hypothetical protein [Streptomyces pathocidini]